MSKYTPTTKSDSRAAISALVLEAMGDAWSDSEEYSALPGVVADLLLMSDWLAAEKAKWQAEVLREAASEMDDTDDPDAIYVSNGDIDLWLLARADRIEKGSDDDR